MKTGENGQKRMKSFENSKKCMKAKKKRELRKIN